VRHPVRRRAERRDVLTVRSPSERQLMGRAEGLMRCLDDLSPLGAFVSARFVKERAIGPLEVWRIRPPAVAGAGTAVVALNAQ